MQTLLFKSSDATDYNALIFRLTDISKILSPVTHSEHAEQRAKSGQNDETLAMEG